MNEIEAEWLGSNPGKSLQWLWNECEDQIWMLHFLRENYKIPRITYKEMCHELLAHALQYINEYRGVFFAILDSLFDDIDCGFFLARDILYSDIDSLAKNYARICIDALCLADDSSCAASYAIKVFIGIREMLYNRIGFRRDIDKAQSDLIKIFIPELNALEKR